MFGSTRRAHGLLRTALVSAMVLVPAGTANAFSVSVYRGLPSTGVVTDVIAGPTGMVTAQRTSAYADDAGITSFRHDGTVNWSAPVTSSMFYGGSPDRIAPASDGSVWFSTDNFDGTVGRVTPTRQVVAQALPGVSEVESMTATNDGRVYVVADGELHQLNTNGTLGPSLANISYPQDLRAAADGSLWWIDGGRIAGTMNAKGEVASYALPFSAASVSADGKGSAWFGAPSEISRLDAATGAITRFPGPSSSKGVAVDHLTTGSDGATWFSSYELAIYGRITATGGMLTWPLTEQVASFASPTAIATGADGNVWIGSRAWLGGAQDLYETLLQRVNVVGSAATADDNRLRPTTSTPGYGSGGSNGANIKTTTVTPATTTITLAPIAKKLKMSKGIIRLPLQCVGGACKAEVTVSAKIGGTKGMVLAHKTVDTQAGKTVKLGLRLSSAGQKAIRRAGRKGFGVLVNVNMNGKTTRSRLVLKK